MKVIKIIGLVMVVIAVCGMDSEQLVYPIALLALGGGVIGLAEHFCPTEIK